MARTAHPGLHRAGGRRPLPARGRAALLAVGLLLPGILVQPPPPGADLQPRTTVLAASHSPRVPVRTFGKPPTRRGSPSAPGLVPTPSASPGSSGSAAGSAAPDAAALATAQAAAAARRVDLLAAHATALSARAQAAAAELAQAFADGAVADQARDQAAQDLARATATRAATVRAVYAEGGPTALMLDVLSAPTADDLLWQLATAQRVTADLVRRADTDAVAAAARAARSLAVNRAGAESDARLAVALRAVQDDAAAAQTALAQARTELGRLSARARAAQEAKAAAEKVAAAQRAAEAARLAAGQQVGALGIPADYEATYRAAALTCPGMRWSLLAAVGQVESGHGRNNGPSSAGAVGPMQFMPATFAIYGVDGDGDGVKDPWNFHDAIFTAARYLCVSGASGGTDAGIRKAIFTYNHAQWYVDLVLGAEQAILARAGSGQAGSGQAGSGP